MSRTEPIDVIVVGAGMAGGAIAHRLTKAGAKVVCLEQGPIVRAVDHPTFGDDWEFAMRRDWAFTPNLRDMGYDFAVKTNGTFMPYLYNAVGGSTNHYSGFWHRLKPVDFRKGTEHGLEGTIDWPLTYEDLAPYYDENDLDVGISGVPGDPAYPARPDAVRQRFVEHGEYHNLLATALEKLDLHWWPADNAILTEDRGDRLACNSCGQCNVGCPRGSLGTATQAYIKPALALGLDLRALSRVTQITTDASGAANGVDYQNLIDGSMHHVSAPLVVVACNGIGTPRTLLMSTSPQHPSGLGNNHDHVGRHFMTHGYRLADMWFDQPHRSLEGALRRRPLLPGVVRHRHQSRLRQRHHHHLRRCVGSGVQLARRHHRSATCVMGRGTPRRVRVPLRPPRLLCHPGRRPAGGDQPGHPRPQRARLQRTSHRGGPLRPPRQHPEATRVRQRPARGDRPRSRGHPYRPPADGRDLLSTGLAPHGHRPHERAARGRRHRPVEPGVGHTRSCRV